MTMLSIPTASVGASASHQVQASSIRNLILYPAKKDTKATGNKAAEAKPQEPQMSYEEMYQMMLREQQELDRQYFEGIAGTAGSQSTAAAPVNQDAPQTSPSPHAPVSTVAYQVPATEASTADQDEDTGHVNKGHGHHGHDDDE